MRSWTVAVTVSTQRKTETIKFEHVTTDGNSRWLAEAMAIAQVMLNEQKGKQRYLRLENVQTWSED